MMPPGMGVNMGVPQTRMDMPSTIVPQMVDPVHHQPVMANHVNGHHPGIMGLPNQQVELDDIRFDTDEDYCKYLMIHVNGHHPGIMGLHNQQVELDDIRFDTDEDYCKYRMINLTSHYSRSDLAKHLLR